MVTGTLSATQAVSSGDSWPCSWAAPRRASEVIFTTRDAISLRNTPTLSTSLGRRRTMSRTRSIDI